LTRSVRGAGAASDDHGGRREKCGKGNGHVRLTRRARE
jgi:hypothetical protein